MQFTKKFVKIFMFIIGGRLIRVNKSKFFFQTIVGSVLFLKFVHNDSVKFTPTNRIVNEKK